MPRDPNSIEAIALQRTASFLHLPNSVRPSVVCVLRIGSGRGAQVFQGESASVDRAMNATVSQAYLEVPTVYQSLNNGRCAEADALSKALNRGIDVTALHGAESQAVICNGGLRLVPPCQSCTQILRRFGIRYTGDSNFNPVLGQLMASVRRVD